MPTCAGLLSFHAILLLYVVIERCQIFILISILVLISIVNGFFCPWRVLHKFYISIFPLFYQHCSFFRQDFFYLCHYFFLFLFFLCRHMVLTIVIYWSLIHDFFLDLILPLKKLQVFITNHILFFTKNVRKPFFNIRTGTVIKISNL